MPTFCVTRICYLREWNKSSVVCPASSWFYRVVHVCPYCNHRKPRQMFFQSNKEIILSIFYIYNLNSSKPVNYALIGSDVGSVLFNAKPLSQTMLTYHQLQYQEQTSAQYDSKCNNLTSENQFENSICEVVIVSWYLYPNYFLYMRCLYRIILLGL